MSNYYPIVKICEKLQKKIPGVCDLKYGKCSPTTNKNILFLFTWYDTQELKLFSVHVIISFTDFVVGPFPSISVIPYSTAVFGGMAKCQLALVCSIRYEVQI